MIKRLALLSLLSLSSISAQAGILSHMTIQHDLVNLAETPSDTKSSENLAARMLYSNSAPAEVFKVWSSYSNQSTYGDRWGEVGLNLLRWTEMGRSYEWKSAVSRPGATGLIYQQDSLVDLERVRAQKITYASEPNSGYQIADTRRFQGERPMTSKDLLANGYAPIGPDNQPVKVCKLGRSSAAPYVEFSETQRLRFAKVTRLNLDGCMVGQEAMNYWKGRYADFIDAYHDITPNHAPGRSW